MLYSLSANSSVTSQIEKIYLCSGANAVSASLNNTSVVADVNSEITKNFGNFVEVDPTKQYRMMFISKCRNGENSQSGNYAMLLQFDGAHGAVSEYCLCRPKNLFIGR